MSEPLACLLLVEDDPVTRAFLREALATLPLRVDAAAGVAAALAVAGRGTHALALLDLNLPDGDGTALPGLLRARGLGCPFVALTADAQVQLDGAIAAAGFVAVAHKPLAASTLRALVGRWLPDARRHDAVAEPARPVAGASTGATGDRADPAVPKATADWDEPAALAAAGGRAEIVDALRGLLRADLPGHRDALRQALAGGDHAAAHSVLHRLQAAAAFCGAARLAAAARALDAALARQGAHDAAWRELQAAVEVVLAAATSTPSSA